MPYHRVNDLKCLTDEEYEDLDGYFKTRFIQGKPDDCWPWMGGTGKHGRGQIVVDGQTVPAPRIAYLLYVGDIPDHDSHHGICVLHECDNPPCVNPKHLFLGTQGDNMRDRAKKGRWRTTVRQGTEHYHAQLTEEIVRAIRADPRRSRDIAAAYDVAQSTVCNIKSYRAWKHIKPEPSDIPVTLHRDDNWTRPAGVRRREDA